MDRPVVYEPPAQSKETNSLFCVGVYPMCKSYENQYRVRAYTRVVLGLFRRNLGEGKVCGTTNLEAAWDENGKLIEVASADTGEFDPVKKANLEAQGARFGSMLNVEIVQLDNQRVISAYDAEWEII